MKRVNEVPEFSHKDVVRYHLPESFNEIPKSRLMDELPRIYSTENWIMQNWEAHFQSVGTPYAVAMYEDEYDGKSRKRKVLRWALWKQRRV